MLQAHAALVEDSGSVPKTYSGQFTAAFVSNTRDAMLSLDSAET